MAKKRINFILARPWTKEEGGDGEMLSSYAMGTTVFYDTPKNAQSMAEKLSQREGVKYEVYIITKF